MKTELYQTLPSGTIRVLDILPGEPHAPIQVELDTVSIANPGDYEALSYTWGDPEVGAQVIQCNGHDFKATANLFSALRRLRLPDDKRRVWIDAICINQSSIPERNQQVQLMLEIYNGAKQVQIWIGDAEEADDIELLFRVANNRNDYDMEKQLLEQFPRASAADIDTGRPITPLLVYSEDYLALDTIERVARRIGDEDVLALMGQTYFENPRGGQRPPVLCVGMRAIPDSCIREGTTTQPLLMPDFGEDHVRKTADQEWPDFESFLREVMRPPEDELSNTERTRVFKAISRFCDRPYWRRAWIVQEVLVSKSATILCGPHQVDYEAFCVVYGKDRRTNRGVKQFFSDDMQMWDPVANAAVMSSMDWTILPDGSTDPGALFGDGYNTLSQMSYHRIYKRKSELTLARLSKDYSEQNATNPRDRIFSLVGLLRHWSRQPRELEWCETAIDYSKDTRDVFIDAARHIVEGFGQPGVDSGTPRREHILQQFRLKDSPTLNLPSWVPDWSAKGEWPVFDTRGRCDLMDRIPYEARVEGERLFLAGHVVDRIEFLTIKLDNSLKNNGMYAEVGMHKQLVEDLGLGKIYGDDQSRSEAFWRTLIADNPIGTKDWAEFTDSPFGYFDEHKQIREWVAHAQANYSKIRQTWSTRLKYRTNAGPLVAELRHSGLEGLEISGISPDGQGAGSVESIAGILDQDPDPEWEGLLARSELSAHRFLVTREGYFGLCPPNVDEGDYVVLLAGSAAPWFLRRAGEHYTIVGRGFVHGLMWKHDAYHHFEWKDGDIRMIELA